MSALRFLRFHNRLNAHFYFREHISAAYIAIRFCSTRPATSKSSAASFLSPDFALSNEWNNRKDRISMEELGGAEFEWITAVQRKFTGGGNASAVDLDMACTISSRADQIADLADLCYRFRHTENATDLLPSTEYAVYRLMLESNDTQNFLKVLNDTINYGLFMNEHLSCLFLDNFLSSHQIQCATKVAIYVMQQELFAWPLLNFLATRALLQWAELPASERLFSDEIHPRRIATLEEETSFNEENVRMFRYPYLKNPHSDGHFDLSEPDQLVGKALEWFSRYLASSSMDNSSNNVNSRKSALKKAIKFVGLLMQQKKIEAKTQIEALFNNRDGPIDEDIICAALQIVQPFIENENLEEKEQKTDTLLAENETLRSFFDQKRAQLTTDPSQKLSDILVNEFKATLRAEELCLMEEQAKQFEEWTERRKKLIHSQAQRVEFMARLDEIQKRRKELKEERVLLYFFENRIRWEDEARERDQLINDLGLMKKKGELSDEEYAQSIFHLARQLKEGKTAKQALEEISDKELFKQTKKSA